MHVIDKHSRPLWERAYFQKRPRAGEEAVPRIKEQMWNMYLRGSLSVFVLTDADGAAR